MDVAVFRLWIQDHPSKWYHDGKHKFTNTYLIPCNGIYDLQQKGHICGRAATPTQSFTIYNHNPHPLFQTTFQDYSEKTQTKIYNIKPGLTSIGSIVFRDEETLISAIKDENPHAYY